MEELNLIGLYEIAELAGVSPPLLQTGESEVLIFQGPLLNLSRGLSSEKQKSELG